MKGRLFSGRDAAPLQDFVRAVVKPEVSIFEGGRSKQTHRSDVGAAFCRIP